MACTSWLVGSLVLLFCTWAVYLGGLASMQAQCSSGNLHGAASLAGVTGLSATVLGCSQVFRYYWFICAIQFVAILGVAQCMVLKLVDRSRLAIVGFFAVVCLLYIQTTDTFLTAETVGYYNDGSARDRVRTTTAGALMTALMNFVCILVVGVEPERCSEERFIAPEKKEVKEVEVITAAVVAETVPNTDAELPV